ncbi:MAG TPA: EAL domain-containing protein, partial [Gemmatimonadaceae bacterium]|nr:EAL domain-containing protein [Gemmatimonadaceae bacterium]
MDSRTLARDSLTHLPTVASVIDSLRKDIQARGELVVMYFNFDRYAKIEDIYGWEKLDALLATTSGAMSAFLKTSPLKLSELMVANVHDDDFVLFHVPGRDVSAASEDDITELTVRLQELITKRVEEEHGESIAALAETFVGRCHVYYNPKIRLERQIYRAMREAAAASKSLEARQIAIKLSDLRETLRGRSIYIDYHPIITADTGAVFGYEALARGIMKSMRSPEVMFDIASESDLIWELSRLCRSKAVEGMKDHLSEGQLLFMNVDPHDFTDPDFTEAELAVSDPSQVVIEITERTAIKDYQKFRGRLKAFRDMGYRFAVDDAGSGYAGLGSIANLEPDFIKLDISL